MITQITCACDFYFDHYMAAMAYSQYKVVLVSGVKFSTGPLFATVCPRSKIPHDEIVATVMRTVKASVGQVRVV